MFGVCFLCAFFGGVFCCFGEGGFWGGWVFSIILYTTCCNTHRSFLEGRDQLGGFKARHWNQGAAISLNTTTTHSSHSNPFKPTAARQLVLAFLFLYGTGLITKTGWLWSAAQKLQTRKSSHSGGEKKKFRLRENFIPFVSFHFGIPNSSCLVRFWNDAFSLSQLLFWLTFPP